MKKVLLLAGLLAFAAPAFSQTADPETPEITAPRDGEEIPALVVNEKDTTVFGEIRVKLYRWWWTSGKNDWEGIGIDKNGDYWYLEHRNGKTYATAKLT